MRREEGKSSIKLILAIAAIVVVIIVGVITYFIIRKRKNIDPEKKAKKVKKSKE